MSSPVAQAATVAWGTMVDHDCAFHEYPIVEDRSNSASSPAMPGTMWIGVSLCSSIQHVVQNQTSSWLVSGHSARACAAKGRGSASNFGSLISGPPAVEAVGVLADKLADTIDYASHLSVRVRAFEHRPLVHHAASAILPVGLTMTLSVDRASITSSTRERS